MYVEFDGLDAHRDAWTKSAEYRLLTETTTERCSSNRPAALDRVMSGQSQVPTKGRELVPLVKLSSARGSRLGINRAGGVGSPRCFAPVTSASVDGAPRSAFDQFVKAGEEPECARQDGREAGRAKSPGTRRFRAGANGLVGRGE